MQELPPPDPGSTAVAASPSVPPKSFPYLAAKLSLWSPFAGLVVFAIIGAIVEFGGGSGPILGAIYLILCSAIWLSGLILGGIALYASKRVGRKSILGRALTGLILDAILLGAIVCVIVVVCLPAWNELAKKNRDKKSQAAFKTAAKTYKDKLIETMDRYRSASAALTNPPVLDISLIKTREDLEVRMLNVSNYINVCREVREVTKYRMSMFAQQITRPEITEEDRNIAMRAFEEKYVSANSTVIQLREVEVRLGHAISRMLGNLDDNWGKWEYDAKDDMIKFKGSSLPRQYVQAKNDFDEANSEFIRLQEEVRKLTRNKTDGD